MKKRIELAIMGYKPMLFINPTKKGTTSRPVFPIPITRPIALEATLLSNTSVSRMLYKANE